MASINLCRELAKRGEEVSIYTTNAMFLGDRRVGGTNVPLNQPIDCDGVEITYFSFSGPKQYAWSLPLFRALQKTVKTFHVVHIHSLYLFHSAAAAFCCRRYGIPYIVKPHGSLDPFLRRRHRLRKWLYDALIERRNLAGASAIHFTAVEEMRLARGAGALKGNYNERFSKGRVVPNGVVVPEGGSFPEGERSQNQIIDQFPELRGKQIILFLGRVNFKKGLDLLIPALGRICNSRKDVHLLIVGPDNEGYCSQVRRWISKGGTERQRDFYWYAFRFSEDKRVCGCNDVRIAIIYRKLCHRCGRGDAPFHSCGGVQPRQYLARDI